MMKKRPRRTLSITANREVTVRLYGWPKKVGMLSVTDEYWAVELQFRGGWATMSHTVFETTDYQLAYAKYEAFKRIAE